MTNATETPDVLARLPMVKGGEDDAAAGGGDGGGGGAAAAVAARADAALSPLLPSGFQCMRAAQDFINNKLKVHKDYITTPRCV